MDLKEYEQRKFVLAEILRSAQKIRTDQRDVAGEAASLLARLAEDRFNIMVVGRFSRGKSTLLNALLGEDYLPSGIVPLTSVITAVRYGSRSQVVLNFMNPGLPQEVPLSRLGEYVTQQGNPGNAKKIALAEIQLPVELLRRGAYFVDSPGLGSAIIENTLTTERFLPQADAFVLVTSYDSPLSEEENRILERIRPTNKRLFVVLNKQDTAAEPDRSAVLDFVRERLQGFSFAQPPEVFSLSARDALEARKLHADERLLASGFPAFQEALMRFLTEERAGAFLSNMFQRTMTFLLQQVHAQRQSDREEDEFRSLANRLHDQEEDITGKSLVAPDLSAQATSGSGYPLEINRKTGCGVCAVVVKEVFDFLSKYQYQLVVSQEEQQEHARRGGFCLLHTWQYEAIASPQGVSEAYPKVVSRFAQQIDDLLMHGTNGTSKEVLQHLLPTTDACRLCQVQAESEGGAVDAVARAAQAALSEDPHVSACCLRHLFLVAEVLGPGEASAALLRSHGTLLERTAEDLQRYALKHYAVRRYLASEEERLASKLSLLLLTGHRNVVVPETSTS